MSNGQDFLSAFRTTPARPQQTLLADVNPGLIPQRDPDFYSVAAARVRGNGVSVEDELFQDVRYLTQRELETKYGYEEAQRLVNLRAGGMAALRNDMERRRSKVEIGTDTATGVINGFVGGIGGLAALAGGVVNEDLGAGISGLTTGFTNWVGNNQSNALNDRRRASQAQSLLSSMDNQATYERERAQQGETIASLRRIGRNFADEAEITLADGALVGDSVSQGVGSLVGGGLISGGLKAIGKTFISRVGAGRAAAVAIARPQVFDAAIRTGQALDRARMPLAIGGLEGGGAYMGTVEELRAMSHDDLLANSELYRELIAEGVEPARAKARVMNAGGLTAAAIQAPIGVITGALVSKFEANPFRIGSAMTGASNVVRETVEEGIQSGTGQLAQNIGVRAGDNDQNLSEGIGEATAKGAIAGAGTAGVFSGPSSVIGTAQEGGRMAARSLSRAIDNRIARGEAINNRDVVNAQADTTAAVKAAIAPKVYVPSQTEGIDLIDDEAEFATYQNDLAALGQQFGFDPQTYEPKTEAEARLLGSIPAEEASNIIDVMQAAANRMAEQDTTPEERLELALFIHEQQNRITPENIEAVRTLQAKVTPGGAIANDLKTIITAQAAITDNILFKDSLEAALKSVPPVKVEDVEDISTPEGQRAARTGALQTMLSPETVPQEVLDRLFKHSENDDAGEIFTPQQKVALRTEAMLSKTLQASTAAAEVLGVKPPEASRVAFEIQTADAQEAGSAGPSVRAHTEGVNRLKAMGDTVGAAEMLAEFGNFAQHMANKLAAVNESFVGRTDKNYNPEVPYQAYNRKTKEWYTPKKGWTVARFDKTLKSIEDSQQIGIDAEYTIDSYNQLVAENPQFGLKPIEAVRMNTALNKPADQVFKDAKKADFDEKNPDIVAQRVETAPVQEQQAEPIITPDGSVVDENDTSIPWDADTTNKLTSPLTGKFKSTVERVMGGLIERFGLPDDIVFDVVEVGKENGGSFAWKERIIGISAKVREALEQGKVGVEYLRRVLAHELGHAIDFYNKNDSRSSGRLRDGTSAFDINKPIYNEFMALKSKDLSSLDYAINFDYIENSMKDGLNEELFAEISALVMTSPNFAQENIPLGYAEFQKVLAAVTKNGTKTDGTGQTESAIVEPTPALSEEKVAERVAEILEAKRADREKAAEVVAEPKAEPEVQATEEAAPIEKKTTSIKEEFPDLIQSTSGENLLLDGFSLDGESQTRLVGEGAITLEDVIAAVTSSDAFAEMTEEPEAKLSGDVTRAYSKVMGAIRLPIYTRLMARFAGRRLKKNEKIFTPVMDGKTPLDKSDPLGIANTEARLLSLMERKEDGSLNYNDKILTAGLLALADWLAQNSVTSPHRDADSVARSLNLTRQPMLVDDVLVNAFNKGTNITVAQRSLANKIEKYLGLKANADVPIGLSHGVTLGFAAELLRAAIEAKFIDTVSVYKTDEFNFVFVNVNTDELGLAQYGQKGPNFKGQTRLIERIVTNDERAAGFSLKPSSVAKKKQKGGNAVTTPEQRDTEVRENAVGHGLNMPVYERYARLGANGMLRLFGNGVLPPTMNKNTRLSKESQNTSVKGAFQTILGLIDQMQSAVAAATTATELKDIRVYYEYIFTSVNRMQQQAAYGNQSSKMVREALTPNGNIVDLSSTDTADYQMWRRGLAQALGIKVELQFDSVWDANLEKILQSEEAKKAISMLQNYTNVEPDALIDAVKDVFRDKNNPLINPEVSEVAFHALVSYADYLTAKANGTASAFTTHIYVEADGKVDGATNSLFYMRLGGFDLEMIEALTRGGFDFSKTPISLAQTYEPNAEGVVPGDAYQVSGVRTGEYMQKAIQNVIAKAKDAVQKAKLINQVEAMNIVMTTLLGSKEFKYKRDGEQWTFEIGRGQLKNPMTITVYGSGVKGIADKVAKELAGKLYEEISRANALAVQNKQPNNWATFMFYDGVDFTESAAKSVTFWKALDVLTSASVRQFEEKYYTKKMDEARAPETSTSAVQYTLKAETLELLSDTIRKFYVKPMVDAINKEMGSSIDGSKLIQESTNLLSSLARAAFDRLISIEMQKIKNKSDGLSPNQIKTIMSKVAFLLPYIEGDEININVKGLEMSPINVIDPKTGKASRIPYASTMNGPIFTQLEIPTPQIAGVAGGSYLNIAYGDGRMIIKASPGLIGGRLMIFDGINLSIKDAIANGVAINKTTLDAIQSGTPFSDLMKTFKELTESFNLSVFTEEELNSVVKNNTANEYNLPDELTPSDFVEGLIFSLTNRLDRASKQERARQATLKRVHLSSDHMAAINAPASTAADNSREDLGALSPEEKAKRLNEIYEEELAKIENAPVVKDNTSENISSAFDSLPKHETGVRITSTAQLTEQLSSLNLPREQATLINRALIALKDDNWTVVIGSKRAATDYLATRGIRHIFKKGDNGIAAPGQKLIVVANGSSETLAHELIHAATFDKVDAFFSNPEVLEPAVRAALERLVILQNEWLNATYLRKVNGPDDTVLHARAAIEGFLRKGDQSSALNEFMAWNLANQGLMNLNSKIKVESKLARITREMVSLLKRMFSLPDNNDRMDWNIRFNSLIVIGSKPLTPTLQAANRILQHSTGTRPDLDDIAQKMAKLVGRADINPELMKKLKIKPSEMALAYGENAAIIAKANGFDMSNEEQRAFVMMVAAYHANQIADPTFNVKMNNYYSEVLEQLDQNVMMMDRDSKDPAEAARADMRYDILRGKFDMGVDMLAVFVALGATNEIAQTLFSRIRVRDKKLSLQGNTVDSVLRKDGAALIDKLMDNSYSLRPNQKIGDEVLKLAVAMVEKSDREQGLLNKAFGGTGNFVRKANDKLADTISFGLGKTADAIQQGIDASKGTSLEGVVGPLGDVLKLGVEVMDKARTQDAVSKLTSMLNSNDVHPEIRSILVELMGSNEDNQTIFELIKKGRMVIDKVRQAFLKGMPKQIKDKFTRTLTKEEWAAQHFAYGQSDISVLLDQKMSIEGIIDLFATPSFIPQLLSQKEAEVKRLFGNQANTILKESADLAQMMERGRPSNGLVKRNALAIANRAGEATVGTFDNLSPETKAIDGYVSLLVLSRMQPDMMNTLSTLAKTERVGMEYALALVAQARAHEMKRVPERHKYNINKGYMPTEKLGSFKAVPYDKVNEYTKVGYKIVGSRTIGAVESLYDNGKQRVYVATDLTAPAVKQGIMRTIRPTVFGLDISSGASYDNPSAGLITDITVVRQITKALRKKSDNDKLLSPLYNKDGEIYAYERLVDIADVEHNLETQQNVAVSVGMWMGRQHEEIQARIINDVLIERMAKMYETAGRRAQIDEFVDLKELAATDPVIADAMSLINDQDMKEIYARMGGKFMVRKDLYNNIIGFRTMSIGDLWTGNTTLEKNNREAAANFLTGILGPEAYRRLTVSEQAWENLMGDARTAIVIKSMLVPALNAAANFFQLMANGIGPIQIAMKTTEMLRETHFYAQKQLELQSLEVDLARARGAKRPDEVRILETKMRVIEDIIKRLAIYPLIQAGEFNQITEGLTQDDLEMTKGRMWDRVSKWADKLPPAVKTAGRYAVVAKDTALFDGLTRTVAYTDFVAKAVLYDHLTRVVKKSKAEALLAITNEFVNYDLLAGRGRTKAEALGLVWFPSFKIRSIKVAAGLIRNNPLHTFLSSMVPGSYEAGTVMDDNGVNLILDGRADNAFGIWNAWRGAALLPVAQVMN